MHVADEGRWIIAQKAHEPIIPIEMWRAANERREKRSANRATVGARARAHKPYLLSGLLFDVSPHDPVTFLALPPALLLVAALASWVPARRALAVEPITALRAE